MALEPRSPRSRGSARPARAVAQTRCVIVREEITSSRDARATHSDRQSRADQLRGGFRDATEIIEQPAASQQRSRTSGARQRGGTWHLNSPRIVVPVGDRRRPEHGEGAVVDFARGVAAPGEEFGPRYVNVIGSEEDQRLIAPMASRSAQSRQPGS